MKSMQTWLVEYAVSHQNPTNKKIHWVCVPLIFFSVIGLLYSIKLNPALGSRSLTAADIVALLAIVYYFFLSKSLAVGMAILSGACLMICQQIESAAISVAWLSFSVFVLAWIGQFIGHKIEKLKPSFFKDLQFLMIGPAWVMSAIYQKLGIRL